MRDAMVRAGARQESASRVCIGGRMSWHLAECVRLVMRVSDGLLSKAACIC
jgi:hypothetical protein